MAYKPLATEDTMNPPWGLESTYKLVTVACDFFDHSKKKYNYSSIEKYVPEGKQLSLTAEEFSDYLEKEDIFSKSPNLFHVVNILERMVSANLLVHDGGDFNMWGLGKRYRHFPFNWELSRKQFQFIPVLGPEYLYKLYAPSVVHITGKNSKDEEVGGTGLVVHSSFVLTCKHVVCGMKEIDEAQTFQGKTCIVCKNAIHKHDNVDIALIQLKEPSLSPLRGARFRNPLVTEKVYTLGYPKIPYLKDAYMVIEPGAVTNSAVESCGKESLFLYSAIARPGNSGGPVVSEDGYVVGMCTQDLVGDYCKAGKFSPYFAGTPALEVSKAVESLKLGIHLDIANFE